MIEIELIVLKTKQVEALRAFYGAMGLAFVEEQHGKGPIHWSAKAGAAVFEVYPLPDDSSPEATTRIGFAVESAKGAIDVLRKSGAAIVSEPKDGPWGIRAVVRDPDGRAVEIIQKIKP